MGATIYNSLMNHIIIILLGRINETESVWPRATDTWEDHNNKSFKPMFLENIDWAGIGLKEAEVSSACKEVSNL